MNAALTRSMGASSAPRMGGMTSDRVPWEFTVNVVGSIVNDSRVSLRSTDTASMPSGSAASATSRSTHWGRSMGLRTPITTW